MNNSLFTIYPFIFTLLFVLILKYTSNQFITEFGILDVYDIVKSYNYMSSMYSPRYKNILNFIMRFYWLFFK